jgi:hypothetical protein
MKELSRLFALLMIAGATLTFTACSDDDADVDPEPEDPTAAALVGDWVMAQESGAFKVGPGVDNGDWFSSSADDVTARACYFDDVYTFGADGSFSMNQGDQTWLETWQGVEADGCGAPIAPHDGSGSYTFGATETSISLSGAGAYLGLAKVYTGGELSADNNTPPATITYTILALNADSSPKTLKLDIAIAGEGHWTFNLVSQ